MFTESDAEQRLPKAIAAASHLRQINSQIEIEPHILDINYSSVERLLDGCDLVIDGTDNFSTRYLLNDACVQAQHKLDLWRCGWFVRRHDDHPAAPNGLPALCFRRSTARCKCSYLRYLGVIMPIINIVSAVQVSEALKLLTGHTEDLHCALMQFDVWRNEWRRIGTGSPRPDCKTCGLGNL